MEGKTQQKREAHERQRKIRVRLTPWPTVERPAPDRAASVGNWLAEVLQHQVAFRSDASVQWPM